MKNLIKPKHLLLAGACLAAITVPAAATRFQSERHDFEVQLVADQLTKPWGMAFLPEGGMLITEKAGRLRLLDAEGLRPTPVAEFPEVRDGGDGGLLGIALDPDFADNRRVYLAYVTGSLRRDGRGTEVIRGELRGPALVNVETIFIALPKERSRLYGFGARLAFDRDGALFISLGDRWRRTPAQNLTSHLGSLIRVNPDGSPPPDNPFIATPGARPEIYTYGNRNMQGLAFQPGTGLLWSHEHGPQGGDELNVMRPGVNYGWPVITYGVSDYGAKIGEGTEKPGMAQPAHVWTPAIAPSGMAFYTGEAFPHWRGNLFVGSLLLGQLARLELQGEAVAHEERLLNHEFGRIRDVKQGPDGFLYFLTDEQDGKLYRLIP